MRISVTLVVAEPDRLPMAQERLELALDANGLTVGAAKLLGPVAVDFELEAEAIPEIRAVAEAAVDGLAADVCTQPADGRRKGLLVADMDSTIIGCECIDELADLVGLKDKVSAITEAAMRGDIDFEGALRARVAMLDGLPVSELARCFDERVRLNPGARVLVQTMRAHGAECFLVSGGFTYFTGRVAEAAGFHANRANRLLDDGEKLTGLVGEPILGREAKLQALQEESARLGLGLSHALAVGDGANDLMMIQAAGLGVAYRAKPVVAAQADARVDHTDLTSLLYFQGYSAEEFAG